MQFGSRNMLTRLKIWAILLLVLFILLEIPIKGRHNHYSELITEKNILADSAKVLTQISIALDKSIDSVSSRDRIIEAAKALGLGNYEAAIKIAGEAQ